ncbi:disease resistance protein RPM1 [Vigna unguiculata]|uniref:Disease resistance protein RPM1 n=1 Tax=Vigna unguiculata TaxID=3917 RepID=A0A4D6LB83_VIGUN|nr:disease resistance protein RPM1 [Vigna unguiculata]
MPVIETLGGALFGAVLQVLLDRLDSRQVLDYFRRRKLDEKLLKKLKRKLVSINAVVDNAEKNQFRTAYMKAWLDEVRDVLLDTEDLMDEIHYEFSRYGLEAESQSSSSKVCIFESRIKEVLEDLESLLNQKDDLGLKNASRVGVGLGFGVDRAKRTLKETRHISFVIDDYGVSCNEYENLYDAKRLRTFLPVTRISYWSWFGVDRAKRTLKETRHISFVIDDYGVSCNEYENLYDAKRLRTFLPVTRISYWSWYCETLTLELIFKLKCLHVLSFCGCVNLKEVPETIGDLMHLRFLDLSNTGIQKLPNTMCSLCDLQTLKLNSCVNLKELPCNFHKLTNLRCLELIKNSLTKMPMHIGKLKNLEIFMMSPFNVGKSSELCIHQLGELSLHGDLVIKDLQNTVNPMDALAADLKSKTCLVRLDLNWDLERNLDNFMKEKEILENLQPSKHLKELSISDYGGIQFPHWLSDNSLSNLVSLSLINCKHCLLLPSLEFLTFLRHLTISGHDWIGTIDADFYRNSCSAFASLETLSFADMKEWEEWQCTTGDFPSLQSLSVTNCPKLKGHLPEQLSHLKKLIIEDCKKLVTVAPRTLEICELHLRDCGKLQIDYNPTTLKMLRIGGDNMEASLLERLGHIISHTSLESFTIFSCPNMNIPINHCFDFLEKLHICGGCDSMTNFPLDFFPRLSEIDLSECPNLQMITQRHPLNHLKILRIGKCSRFEYFPNEGLFARQLESFYIIGLENLKSLPKHMSDLLPSLNLLYINDCPEVEVSDGYLPSNLDEMCLFNCSKLIVSLKGPWGTNPSLKSLSIGKVDEDCFPGEGLLPLSITNLEIYDCPNLKKLDYRGLCHLSSLEKLFLYKCPILQCLPEEGLPKSISKLRVEGCPLLKKRCKKQEGEDWEKIAHIKYIIVDRERVNI